MKDHFNFTLLNEDYFLLLQIMDRRTDQGSTLQ